MSDMKDARYPEFTANHSSGREDLRDRAVPRASLDDWNHEDGSPSGERTHQRNARQDYKAAVGETPSSRRPRITLDEVLRWYGDEY